MTLLVMLTLSMVSGWAKAVDSRLDDYERRMSSLDRQYAVIEQQMKQNSLDHEQILSLLRQEQRRAR